MIKLFVTVRVARLDLTVYTVVVLYDKMLHLLAAKITIVYITKYKNNITYLKQLQLN